MEYISAEEFLKQPVEVQKIFIDWWKPSDGDIFWWNKDRCIDCCYHRKFMDNKDICNLKKDKEVIPLFAEGQLRKFIEDKTSGIIDIGYYGDSEGEYEIKIYKLDYKKDFILDDETGRFENYTFEELGKDLLQAYWKVACQIAKED